jgi:hypothetical protein
MYGGYFGSGAIPDNKYVRCFVPEPGFTAVDELT